jgi:hypothetical protein
MRLASARLVGVGPFDDACVRFASDDGVARPVTVIHGGGGVGKTALLHAIAHTRPGQTIALLRPGAAELVRSADAEPPPHCVCEWWLGDDDPTRPHPLQIASPNAPRGDGDEGEAGLLRRREQAHFDRRAREHGGFVFVALPSTRWFSRQPLALHSIERGIARYDVRATTNLDDANRADLARETKQALAYAAIGRALAHTRSATDERDGPEQRYERAARATALGDAMAHTVTALVGLIGATYVGLDPRGFEPLFTLADGRMVAFDDLPTRARQLVAFAALPTRALWSAYDGEDPRGHEGVVAIDEVDHGLDPGVQASLADSLQTALPRVQWLLTTTSPEIAASCDPASVVALRPAGAAHRVEVHVGTAAQTH